MKSRFNADVKVTDAEVKLEALADIMCSEKQELKQEQKRIFEINCVIEEKIQDDKIAKFFLNNSIMSKLRKIVKPAEVKVEEVVT